MTVQELISKLEKIVKRVIFKMIKTYNRCVPYKHKIPMLSYEVKAFLENEINYFK